MATEGTKGPAPRPRRRRTDIDPKAPTPKVANERRRRKGAAAALSAPESAALADALAAAAASRSRPPKDRRATDASTPTDATAAPDATAAHDDRAIIPTEPIAPGLPAADWTATVPSAVDASPTKVFHLPGITGNASGSESEPGPAPAATEPSTTSPGVGDVLIDPAEDDRSSWLPQLDDRAVDPRVCPFLRAATDDGLRLPIERPDPSNRCAALRDVVPQSLRQQELVCLSSGHVRCPRYLRGAAVVSEPPRPVVRRGRTLSPAVLGSLLVLVVAFSASIAFVLSRGGLELTPAGADPSASQAVIAPPSESPSVSPSREPRPIPSAVPSASPSPTPEPTPQPTPEPTPTAASTDRPNPTSDRYQLLTRCQDAANCWIYRVRSGDNLYSIANYFGVSQDSIYERNPWVRNQGLRAGQELRLPPPTR